MTFWQWVLAVCGGLAAIGGAIAAIKKIASPLTELNSRIKKVEEHDERDLRRSTNGLCSKKKKAKPF